MVVSQSAKDKAPGPDGMNMRALKFLWPNIKNKVYSSFLNFAQNLKVPKGFNSSFISLVPKVKDPNEMHDFRPISLINCSAKLLTKILANRLTPLMSKLIDDTQTWFIKGRQAAESIVVVNEVFHSLKRCKRKGFILKLDFEKKLLILLIGISFFKL